MPLTEGGREALPPVTPSQGSAAASIHAKSLQKITPSAKEKGTPQPSELGTLSQLPLGHMELDQKHMCSLSGPKPQQACQSGG